MKPSTKVGSLDVVELGVSYLRVSDKSQLDTAADIDPNGNSISTQRQFTQNKARSMGVLLDREFIEPGNSAQTIAKRPVFRELLAYLKQRPDIKYVFIYTRSRAFRNYLEAGVTEHQLNERGVKLVSAKEDFGEGIMADGMKALTDVINWMEVRRNGEDIKVKMANKARNGGTLGRAKLGYANIRIDVDGRKVNTIGVDEVRAPLVIKAFELFATGLYTLDSLLEVLADLGLKAPGKNKPITRETLHHMLRDRYYIGKVLYKGIEYPGRHEPLIDEELFDRVQRILDAHSGSGVRQRQHQHYLKGLVWCGRCQHRYIIMPGRGNGGEYFYFMCRGRQQKLCDQPYIPTDVMERLIEQHYAHAVILPDDARAKVREAIHAAIDTYFELNEEQRALFTRQLEKLDSKESYFLDLAAEEGWPKEKLRDKINAIRAERQKITRQLDHAASQLETGKTVFLIALDLLDNPHGLYMRAHDNEPVRTTLNRAFFTRIYVDGGKITAHELNEPFDVLAEGYTLYRREQADRRQRPTYYRTSGALALTADLAVTTGQPEPSPWPQPQTASSADLLTETGATSRDDLIRLLAPVFADRGSSRPVMVGTTGFEPATP